MSETNTIFRGNCAGLKAINSVGIDLEVLVEEIAPAFPGEPAKKVFPVRSQLSWFRLKNENGKIVTQIAERDDFMAIVNATVYNKNGDQVSNAHGSADATNDGIHGFKLVETAESRAISRALDFAGYGCQLDLKTFDDRASEPVNSDNQPVGNAETQFPNEAPPIPQPGVPKGRQKVDANATSGIVDIADMEKAAADSADSQTPTSDTPKRGKGKKKDAETIVAGEQVPPAAALEAASEDGAASSASENDSAIADDATTAQKPAEDADAPADEEVPADSLSASEDVQNGNGDDSSETTEPAENTPTGTAPEESAPAEDVAEPGSPATEEPTSATAENEAEAEAEGDKSAEVCVSEHIAMVLGSDNPKPAFDPFFFAEGTKPEDMAVNRDGRETKINNLELQIAISFLQENPALIERLIYPARENTPLYGKTFGEILETPKSAAIIKSCADLYNKDNVSAYAAALILNANAKEDGSDK